MCVLFFYFVKNLFVLLSFCAIDDSDPFIAINKANSVRMNLCEHSLLQLFSALLLLNYIINCDDVEVFIDIKARF